MISLQEAVNSLEGVQVLCRLIRSPVVWGMIAGNNNGNNSVSVSDYNAVANNLFQIGYIIADHNMNGSVSVTDYNPVSNNLFKISQVP